jgi:hypothetical protein
MARKTLQGLQRHQLYRWVEDNASDLMTVTDFTAAARASLHLNFDVTRAMIMGARSALGIVKREAKPPTAEEQVAAVIADLTRRLEIVEKAIARAKGSLFLE